MPKWLVGAGKGRQCAKVGDPAHRFPDRLHTRVPVGRVGGARADPLEDLEHTSVARMAQEEGVIVSRAYQAASELDSLSAQLRESAARFRV